MRVLFCTLPQNTHFLTMAPLGWALRTAGHDVCVAVQPGFVDEVTQSGLTATAVGTDQDPDPGMDTPEAREAIRRGLPPPYDLAERPPRAELTWTPALRDAYQLMVTHGFAAENDPVVADLVSFARSWSPDLVLWEPFTFAGAVAATACGAAHGRLLFTMDILGVTHARLGPHLRAAGEPDPLLDWLAGHAREYGFELTDDMVAGQFTVDQTPGPLRIEADLPYLPMRYIPYGGAATVPKWLWAPPERPRVALTMGRSGTEYFNGYTFRPAEILDALADLDIEVVATVAEPERERLGPVPGNARVVSYVPLHALAPTCAAAIHHGGFGTLTTFALYGVPQLALPYHFEGPLLSRKLAAQGAGLALHSDQVTGPAVRERLLRLLREPAFTAHAAGLRDEIHTLPTPHQLVPQLEELTAKHRTALS